ncbi:uncharacterized protein LOC144040329 [Vanacampus margaritifer]
MSRQMSPPSPQSRRFTWDEHGPYRASAGHYGSDWRPTARDEDRRFGEDMFPEGQRRSPPSPSQGHFWHQRDQEGSFRRRPSPRHDLKDRQVPRSSPQRDGGSNADRQQRGFREDLHQSFNSSGRSPCSPPRFQREKLPLSTNSLSEHSQGASGWRRDAEWRGQGRFRDVSPSVRSEEQRGSRRDKNTEDLNRSRQREDIQPILKRLRRESDNHHHSGFKRDNKDFGDQRHSSAKDDGDFRRDPPGTNALGPGTLRFNEHGQRFQDNRKGPRLKHSDNGGQREIDVRHRRAGQTSSSQEQLRTSNRMSDVREDSRKRHNPDNWRDGSEHKRSPPPQERTNLTRFDRQGAATNQRGSGGSHPARGRFSHDPVGKNGNRTNFQQSSRSHQNVPREEPRAGYRSQRDTCYSNAEEEEAEPGWTREEDDERRLEHVQPASLDRRWHRDEPDVERPRTRVWEEPDSKSMTVVTEETLTIKVDMSRSAPRTSSLCYSAERQLSMDLVNVSRQRLGFVPDARVPDGDGGGTFAQEIITLVHSVKELYFQGNGIMLNKRFSVPQQEEGVGLTLDQRFSSNHMNMTPSPDNIQPLFPGLTGTQLSHGPGDLRHDLERRRQKRLEGVTITIPGTGQPAPAKIWYGGGGGDAMFPDDRDYRRDGNAGPRQGGQYRMNAGPTSRFKSRQPVRMQNRHNNDEGPSW